MECDGTEAICSGRDPAEGFNGHMDYPGLCQSQERKESPSLPLRKEIQTLFSEERAEGQSNG